MLEEEDIEKKDDQIVIRCRPSTKKKFRLVAAQMGARNYEEALLRLIELYNKSKKEEVRLF